MSDIKDILKGSLVRLGVAKQVEAVGVIAAATKEIAKFIEPADFEVISYKDGVLKVFTNSSSAGNSLNLVWPKIKKALETEGFQTKRILITSRSNPHPQ